MKDRGKINLIIALLMFLNFALICGIGLLIKYTLPPGRERMSEFGSNTKMFFLGLDRHQWGTIHLTAAYVMLALLALHIILHWPAIKVLARKAVPNLWLRRALAPGLVMLGAGLMLFSFAVKPENSRRGNHLRRHSLFQRKPGPEMTFDMQEISNQDGVCSWENGWGCNCENKEEAGESEKEFSASREKHEDQEKAEPLQGKMTIADAARLYGISSSEVKKRLRIPESVSDYETIGRLRRTYGFTMAQPRERLEKSQ